MTKITSFRFLTLATLVMVGPVQSDVESDVLATVGGTKITSLQLERSLNSSPFITQFNTMDRNAQATLRGNLLKRLVASRLLLLEARRLGFDNTDSYQRERADFRLGLLYRKYLDRLRADIRIPQATLAEMKRQLKGNANALAAARASWRARRYHMAKADVLRQLRGEYAVQIHTDRIGPEPKPDTVILSGTGVEIHYGDIVDVAQYPTPPNPEWIRDRLDKRAELLLLSRAAISDGIDVDEQVAAFEQERLPALLLEYMERRWIPDEQTLRDHFDAHPELGRIPEQRHIGQLVLATRAEARAMRERILAGESLFVLAGTLSIDPYGRERNGDMGWLREGTGLPRIEQAIAGLEDGELSEVVETPKGFHLVTVLERRRGVDRPFESIKDRVRQDLVAKHMPPFLDELEQRYPVQWQLLAADGGNAP